MITTTKPRRSSAPIKWHGGKNYLASRIVSLIPNHVHYIEPFFGGGAVFFKKTNDLIEQHSEIVNDSYGELMNFWQVLQSDELFTQFEKRVALTPFAKPIWESSLNDKSQCPVDRAWAFFVRYRQSRQGLGRDFATMSRTRTRRGMNEQVSSWLSAIEGLPEAHERLKRVVVLNEDALSVIRREDGKHSFFYCDPPYLANTRVVPKAYEFEMTDSQHEELLNTLGTIQGKFLLSGYMNPMYNSAAKHYGWQRIDIPIDNKASSKKIKPKKIECLWANYEIH